MTSEQTLKNIEKRTRNINKAATCLTMTYMRAASVAFEDAPPRMSYGEFLTALHDGVRLGVFRMDGKPGDKAIYALREHQLELLPGQ